MFRIYAIPLQSGDRSDAHRPGDHRRAGLLRPQTARLHVRHHHARRDAGQRDERHLDRRRQDAAHLPRLRRLCHRHRLHLRTRRLVIHPAPALARIPQGRILWPRRNEQILHREPHHPLHQRHHADPDVHHHRPAAHRQVADHGRMGHMQDRPAKVSNGLSPPASPSSSCSSPSSS